MAKRRKTLIGSPALYSGWLVLTVVALVISYRTDPYVFGFTTLGLGALTAAVALAGLAGAWLRREEGWRPALGILVPLLLAFLAIFAALQVLGTFSWA
jgi:hypothetical protein